MNGLLGWSPNFVIQKKREVGMKTDSIKISGICRVRELQQTVYRPSVCPNGCSVQGSFLVHKFNVSLLTINLLEPLLCRKLL